MYQRIGSRPCRPRAAPLLARGSCGANARELQQRGRRPRRASASAHVVCPTVRENAIAAASASRGCSKTVEESQDPVRRPVTSRCAGRWCHPVQGALLEREVSMEVDVSGAFVRDQATARSSRCRRRRSGGSSLRCDAARAS